MDTNYQGLVKVLKALSDPKRLRIVHMLNGRELGASSILEAFQISQPTLSHDMRVLVDTGLVLERRNGKHVLYRLNTPDVQAFLAEVEALMDGTNQPSE